jgi:hypothetical protein
MEQTTQVVLGYNSAKLGCWCQVYTNQSLIVVCCNALKTLEYDHFPYRI